jgi:hypothetical protein
MASRIIIPCNRNQHPSPDELALTGWRTSNPEQKQDWNPDSMNAGQTALSQAI